MSSHPARPHSKDGCQTGRHRPHRPADQGLRTSTMIRSGGFRWRSPSSAPPLRKQIEHLGHGHDPHPSEYLHLEQVPVSRDYVRGSPPTGRAEDDLVVRISLDRSWEALRCDDGGSLCDEGDELVRLLGRRIDLLPGQDVRKLGQQLGGRHKLVPFHEFGEETPGFSMPYERRDEHVGVEDYSQLLRRPSTSASPAGKPGPLPGSPVP